MNRDKFTYEADDFELEIEPRAPTKTTEKPPKPPAKDVRSNADRKEQP